MFFYAVFPFLLIAVQRDALATLALAALAATSIFALGVGLGLPVWESNRMTPTLISLGSYNPLARGFEFALGMVVYRLWRRVIAPARLSAVAWTAIEAAALTLLVAWLAFAVPTIEARLAGPLFVWFRVSGSCWACALLIVVIAAGRGAIGRLLSTRPLVYLGEISYAFYIFHVVALRALSYHFGPHPSEIAAFALSLYLAAANRAAIERPGRAWLLTKFERSVAAPARAASPP
jgi:peptidoglycan/LPS O-acetylase OafA/YrhL